MSLASDRSLTSGAPKATTGERFGPLVERGDGVDFPYYDGSPVAFSARQWILLWGSVVVGFLMLVFVPAPNAFVALIPRILFTAIPLGALALATQEHWTALFRRVRGADVLLMVAFAILNIAVSSVLALVVRAFFATSANPAEVGLGKAGPLEFVAFYLGTGIQIVGEEVFTILPFLAILSFGCARGGLSRKAAILLAWVLTALWFGAAHLPTYDWNVAQALVVIGGARLVLTLAYIRTKNLWVSAGAHILSDWVLFTVTLVAAGLIG